MPDEALGYIVTVYFGRGLPPERSDFEDKVKAEKAFTDAKAAAILWQSRSVGTGLGWIKIKEKEAPPVTAAPAAPVAKPAAVPAAAAAKPAAVAAAPAVAAAAKPPTPPAGS